MWLPRSRRRAASRTRCWFTHQRGVAPVRCRKRRAKVRADIDARAARASTVSWQAGADPPRVARQRHPRHRAARRRHGRCCLGGAEDPGRDRRAAARHRSRLDDHHQPYRSGISSSSAACWVTAPTNGCSTTHLASSPAPMRSSARSSPSSWAGGCSASRSAGGPCWPPLPSLPASPSSCCTPGNQGPSRSAHAGGVSGHAAGRPGCADGQAAERHTARAVAC